MLLHLTKKWWNRFEKKQEAVDSNKVALPHGRHNLKKVGSTDSPGKKHLGCREWIFAHFIENQQ